MWKKKKCAQSTHTFKCEYGDGGGDGGDGDSDGDDGGGDYGGSTASVLPPDSLIT